MLCRKKRSNEISVVVFRTSHVFLKDVDCMPRCTGHDIMLHVLRESVLTGIVIDIPSGSWLGGENPQPELQRGHAYVVKHTVALKSLRR